MNTQHPTIEHQTRLKLILARKKNGGGGVLKVLIERQEFNFYRNGSDDDAFKTVDYSADIG